MAVTALAAAGGCAAIKTSLFVGKARDANGNLYVNGGELGFAMVDVAANVGGLGAAAKATKALEAAKASKGLGVAERSFGKVFVDQFKREQFGDAWDATKQTFKRARRAPAAPFKDAAANFGKDITEMGIKGQRWVARGVAISTLAPAVTLEGNWAGIKSTLAVPRDFFEVVADESGGPDLTLRRAPEKGPATEAHPKPTISEPAPEPVMRPSLTRTLAGE